MIISKKQIMSKFGVNRIIWYLTLSDIFTWGLFLVINTILGIYLSSKLGTNAIEYIGIGTAIYYLSKGLFQIPISIVTDSIKKDKDDILFLLLGNFLMSIPFFFYPIITNNLAYFILQFIMGIGCAMNLVNWRKLFAQNLDNGKEGYDYAIYDSILSIAGAIFSLIAGFVASINQVYFDFVIVGIGVLMFSSGIWVISIYFVNNRKSNK